MLRDSCSPRNSSQQCQKRAANRQYEGYRANLPEFISISHAADEFPAMSQIEPTHFPATLSIAAIRRAVPVNCRTSSGDSGRPRTLRSRYDSHFLRTW